MAIDNRPTAEQLAALKPGDTVTIESEASFGRPRHAAGTVVHVLGPDIVVKVPSRHGVAHRERYRRRDGIRIGGVSRAEFVNANAGHPAATSGERRQAQRIDGLYRAWNRNRTDVDTLRQSYSTIGNYLASSTN